MHGLVPYSKRKKDKKKHKDSKSSKKSRHRDKSPSSSSGSSSGSENEGQIANEWVERTPILPIPKNTEDIVPEKHNPAPSSSLTRDDWMSIPKADVSDPFSLFQKDISKAEKIDTEKVREQERKETIRKERELNPYFANSGSGLPSENANNPTARSNDLTPTKKKIVFGDSGSNWRMMKLKKVYEIADRENKSVKEVALNRYGCLEEFEEAVAERGFLDGGRKSQHHKEGSSARDERNREKYRLSSGFQRPRGEGDEDQDMFGRAKKPSDIQSVPRNEGGVQGTSATTTKSSSSLISIAAPITSVSNDDNRPPPSKDTLNKLNAKILQATILGMTPDPALVTEYEEEKRRYDMYIANGGNAEKKNVVVLSSIDSQGRLQDIGDGSEDSKVPPGNKRKRPTEVTHDTQGQRIKFSGDAEGQSIHDLLLEEKMTSGDSYDMQMANRIAKDATYKEGLDYMDERAEDLAKRTMKTEEKKRQHAVIDFKKAEVVHQKCNFCWQNNNTTPPRAQIIALGTKTYLATPQVVNMVPGHCLIVPIQHVTTLLDCDDDVWDEIRNFQKCIIQMQWEKNCGVIFIEQVIHFKWQKHTVIECIPVPLGKFEDAPSYFREAMNSAEDEWSQHKKIIDTSKNGFRRSMVKNLPYIHVWFDPNRGMGHVIEDEQEWEEWFGREVLGSMMELSPDKWRRPKRLSTYEQESNAKLFKADFAKFDWTKMLD